MDSIKSIETTANGLGVDSWLKVTEGWRIWAYLSDSDISTFTVGAVDKHQDMIHTIVHDRREALRELAEY